MANKKGGSTVSAVWEIAKPIAEELGLSIWDIRYLKEVNSGQSNVSTTLSVV